jgi:hypothetical protein
MKEASVVKYYFIKYFFLVLGLLQIAIGAMVYFKQGHQIKGQFTATVFSTLGLVFVSLYLIVSSRIKRVAIGKKKIAIIDYYKTRRYDLGDIKFIRLVPVFNLYCLKIKGKKGRIYFLPTEKTQSIYGLFHTTPELILKKEK